MRFTPLGLIIIPLGILLYKLYESYSRENATREKPRYENKYNGENQTICVICLNDLHFRSITRLPCKHKFHTACIRDIFEVENTRSCPLCRSIVASDFRI